MTDPAFPAAPAAGYYSLRASEWLAIFQRDAAARDARRALRQASGLCDEDLLESLRRIGMTPAALPALDLAPAILVGWADGSMSRLELDRLRALAVIRAGITESHAAWALVQQWVIRRPSPEDERVLLDALVARLERLPVRKRLRRRLAILRDCDAVARASGRVLGGPKVCRDERKAIADVEARLAG
ncbi:MAG: hypothetical protein OEW19_02260 [Acidobacteriota bacterium]|nr:hypothetical protein [Acidobacteriota bacterium]